jgi:tRNA modification GTPase
MDGIPLRFSDTAGIRETTDRIESAGVARTLDTLSDSQLVLVVLDGSSVLDANDDEVLARAKTVPHFVVVNKCDLVQVIPQAHFNGAPTVRVSARTGEGLSELRDAIHGFLLSRTVDADDFVLTNIRQNEAMVKAISALRAGIDAIERHVPHEMVLLDLYAALSALDEMTGDVAAEDILDRIFSSFCIGK